MTRKKERSEKGANRPTEKRLTLLLLGLGIFQIIAALLALLLWLAEVQWQSYLVAIALVSVVLTIPLVVWLRNARA